ncbi:hypothetical protein LCGC14_1894550, partial [marine sediment metagenome]
MGAIFNPEIRATETGARKVSNLIKQLRSQEPCKDRDGCWHCMQQAADALEQAQATIERLNTAVKQFIAADAKVGLLEAALHPGKQACDCCIRQQYKGETFWMIECQCGNHDDIGRAQAWCS